MATKRSRRLEYVPLDDIVAADRNPKAHDPALIAASIGRFGFIETPVIDERTGKLVAGHGRTDELRAARERGDAPPEGIATDAEGRWLVPTLRGWSSRDDADALAAGVALNRVGEAGGWDYSELEPMLTDWSASGPDALLGLGFDASDLEAIRAQLEQTKRGGGSTAITSEATMRVSVPDEGDERSRRGDVWLLGPHRVMCGDCREAADVDTLLDGAEVHVGFTSPPYAEQRDYDPESGFRPVPPAEYVEWFAPVASHVASHLAADGSWFVNIKPTVTPDMLGTELYVMDLVLAHARAWGWHFATEFCWERGGVPRRVRYRFKNQFEPVYQFTRGPWKIRPDAVRYPSDHVPVPAGPGIGETTWSKRQGATGDRGLKMGMARWEQKAQEEAEAAREDAAAGGYDYEAAGGNYPHNQGTGAPLIVPRKHGHSGNMSAAQGENVAVGEYIVAGHAYPGNRLPTFAGSHEAVGHAAAFPVGLPAWFLRAYSDPGDNVYDPFLGSGSTVLAAHEERRVGFGMELSPRYVDVVCARWQAHTGILPIHSGTDEPVDFLNLPGSAADQLEEALAGSDAHA